MLKRTELIIKSYSDLNWLKWKLKYDKQYPWAFLSCCFLKKKKSAEKQKQVYFYLID